MGISTYHVDTVFIMVFCRTCVELWIFPWPCHHANGNGVADEVCWSPPFCREFVRFPPSKCLTHGDNIDNCNLHTFSEGATIRYNCRRVHNAAINLELILTKWWPRCFPSCSDLTYLYMVLFFNARDILFPMTTEENLTCLCKIFENLYRCRERFTGELWTQWLH